MTKKHFEYAAEICRKTYAPKHEEKARAAKAHAFVELFSAFNPRFDRERFFEACNVPESLR